MKEETKKYEDADLQSVYKRLQKTHITFRTTPLNNIDKKLKALEIIKNKEVSVFIFLLSGDLKTYNGMIEDSRKLTQEEYELLKEILK